MLINKKVNFLISIELLSNKQSSLLIFKNYGIQNTKYIATFFKLLKNKILKTINYYKKSNLIKL